MAQLQLALKHDERLDATVDEPLLYHDTERSGFTALLRPGGTPRQLAVRLHELPSALRDQRLHNQDLYIAQNEFFRPNRRVVSCSRLTSCYVDLDTYKLDSFYGQPAEALTDRLLRQCDDARIPPPSIVVYSGRGLQAKWLLERPVPSSALPRWQALQTELARRLSPMGADLRALDASRVLRLVGSVNSRSGDLVRVVHLQRVATFGGAIGPARVAVYPFDSFFDDVLPLTRHELAAQRAEIAERIEYDNRIGPPLREPYKPVRRLQLVETGRLATARRIIPSELAWDRLADLRKLAELRHGVGGIPSGQRNVFVVLGACFLASALVAPSFRSEVLELGKEFAPTWSAQELASCISSVERRLEAAAKGETVEYMGQPVDPRYRFKNSTLIDWLSISSEEMMQLRTIVSADEKRNRDRARKEAERRLAGRLLRTDYERAAQQKAEMARALREQGHSLGEIAQRLGISRASAHGYCRTVA
jgi:hypothetical protein